MKGHNYGLCRKCEATHEHPRGTLGKKLNWQNPEERVHKISIALKGRFKTTEHCKHLSEARRGRHYPKLSIAKLGKPLINPILSSSPVLAYILGVLKGDGFVIERFVRGYKKGEVGLGVTEEKFARKFLLALIDIGLHPSIWQANNPCGKLPIWHVYAQSIAFAQWYKSLTLTTLGNTISGFAIYFLCGFYESEGHLANYHRPHLNHEHHIFQIFIGNSNQELIEPCYDLLQRLDFHPTTRFADKSKWGRKPQYSVNLCRHAEVERFLKVTKPCIKGG